MKRERTRSLLWLSRNQRVDAFPPASEALTEPNGLLAAGGDLEPERLLAAYRQGIFPWYSEGQPILWWSPDPRAVLWPNGLRVSRSLRRSLRRRGFEFRVDTEFERVVAACAEPRRYASGTWITAEMAAAYARLHEQGWAHSFETWAEGRLVGGLYGVAIGRAFFGESMFTRVTDASKVALAHAVEFLRARGTEIIDCQVASAHTQSLGAVDIPRAQFLALIAELCAEAAPPQTWRFA
ncbi:MAG TPA: leucyl/phenylalanyl-tRNA--protein transferase [Gammaproteobacteria bacterium]|nr:leucyl/phenylalanyl-tRNA--protein transferase [Gammaproteobacteria bacterium]